MNLRLVSNEAMRKPHNNLCTPSEVTYTKPPTAAVLNLWVATPWESHISDIMHIRFFYIVIHNSNKISYEVALKTFYGWGSRKLEGPSVKER